MTSAVQHRPRTLWEEGRRPAQDLVSLVVAVLLTVTVLDLVLSDGLGFFFDLAFVTICVGAALAVRPADFFPIGVLPPLAMFLVVAILAVSDPGAVADVRDGAVQATVAGLATHALALVIGYGACLGLLAVRHHYLSRHPG